MYEFLKEHLGDELFSQVSVKLKDNKTLKLVDLSSGEYVSKNKFDDKLKEVETLKGNLETRDTDLKTLQEDFKGAKKQLKEFEGSDKTISELETKVTELQGKYETDTKTYESQLQAQAYDFAIKEATGAVEFTSKLAKESFISKLKADENKLLVKDGNLQGFDDFVKKFKESDPDAFKAQEPDPAPNEQPNQFQPPKFVAPTSGGQQKAAEGDPFGFNFNAVRDLPAQK